MSKENFHVAIVAGESSGDSHGAHLIKALQDIGPDFTLQGIGGPKLRALGLDCIAKAEDMAVVGLIEVFFHLPHIWRAFRKMLKSLRNERPDLLVLVDYPDFNLRIAKKAAKMGIPVVYFVSPQVWAWRGERIHQIKRDVDHMLVILPFEETYYQKENVPVTFVGHPLVEHPPPRSSQRAFLREKLNWDLQKKYVVFAPGSRSSEVARILPIMANSAELLLEKHPELEIVLPVAPSLDIGMVSKLAGPIKLEHAPYRDILAAADIAAVASGTACLEAALTGTPTCIVYKLQEMTYRLAKSKLKVKFAGMPNLIHPEHPWPEFVQERFTPENLAGQLNSWVSSPTVQYEFSTRADELFLRLKGPGLKAGAEVLLKVLNSSSRSDD